MTVRLTPHVSLTRTETGMVLLDEATGRYFELNQAGATALDALLDGASLARAAQLVSDGTPEGTRQALTDLDCFLRRLADNGLATVEEPHDSPARTGILRKKIDAVRKTTGVAHKTGGA